MLPNMIGYHCDYRYWPYTSGRSVRLYTGECVVDSGTVLWDRALVTSVVDHLVRIYLNV